MSEANKFGDSIKSAAGKVKQTVGTDSMAADGKRMEAEADAQYKSEQAEQQGKGMLNSAIGKVKETVGKVVGNERLQAEGKADHAEGSVQRKAAEH